MTQKFTLILKQFAFSRFQFQVGLSKPVKYILKVIQVCLKRWAKHYRIVNVCKTTG